MKCFLEIIVLQSNWLVSVAFLQLQTFLALSLVCWWTSLRELAPTSQPWVFPCKAHGVGVRLLSPGNRLLVSERNTWWLGGIGWSRRENLSARHAERSSRFCRGRPSSVGRSGAFLAAGKCVSILFTSPLPTSPFPPPHPGMSTQEVAAFSPLTAEGGRQPSLFTQNCLLGVPSWRPRSQQLLCCFRARGSHNSLQIKKEHGFHEEGCVARDRFTEGQL